MPSPKISFIVPYSHRPWCADDGRLLGLLGSLACIKGCETLLHVSGPLPANLAKPLQQFENLKCLHSDKPAIYSAGQARNEAVAEARGDYLFFVDADLMLHPQLAQTLCERAEALALQGVQAFEMYPCIYLSQKVAVAEYDNGALFIEALQGLMKGHYSKAEGIALASSCLLVNRQWFNTLGGFDARFVGHGGEDLDLVHRLCLHFSAGERPDDYAQNLKSQFVGDARGFRRYALCYALPHLFEGRFLLHRWHPRPLSRTYHRQSAPNDIRLAARLGESEQFEVLKAQVDMPADWQQGFRDWLADLQQQKGWPVDEFPGLFALAKGENIPRPVRNKLRKLLINPRLFFIDAFRKHLS
ncbi:glycosyltransferase [Shewanella khirikhana]|uniref:glycosyltransferase n=1 Tax=Shewanella khirikhana TaxID=1965282 RepID=UPI0030D1019B